MFRAAAPPHGFSRAKFWAADATKRRPDDPRGVHVASLPGLTRQSIFFEKLLYEADGCAGQARA
jgi:hypothetical protein